ncbi:TonB-dependent receptor [Pectobacterium versatile]|uniref:TonB-dependent siderophore receptor n=1 Tax=Pectobacterium versatile TaxID=2488639 RepID=A0AAW3RWX9_9GAMM|nr:MULTISPECIES: TonB-dependent siderophore receptor [Pectobacterium]MBA0160849.1 TonB-dependent siderophore receptor [Pectobacterium versatile]MBD0845895.1 fatty-acid--CoA ligase [Pectobacterium carotovorum subsp. carotovorum]MBK4827396.1 Ferrichrysobactin receptor [Pectobacterium carotovorum subsp. carotovorum]MCL6334393.1 TonB-dependent siderophore receptor [Pectobacterium carotovorum subsp. carotovorum]MCL6347081.1 TonB-dependent siderophore receptor [Pectobacterium carotovorum subsp. caro
MKAPKKNNRKKAQWLLPALMVVVPPVLSAEPATSNASEKAKAADVMIVKAEHSETNANLAGAGMTTDDVEIGPLGKRSRLDTPYSTTTVTEAMIANQQAKNVNDLLKYSASSQMQARGGIDVGRPQSRGMQGDVLANSRLDGLNIISTTAFPVEMLERLDVINSLTGALYGPASPSGQFNFTQKRPTAQTLNRFTVGYSGKGAAMGHADLGGHLGDENQFGYRVNLLHDEGEGSISNSTLRRQLASVAFDWNISPDTVLEVNASEYRFRKMGYAGGFSYGPTIQLPSAPDVTKQGYGQSFAGLDLVTKTASTRLKHYFNNNWYASGGVGYQTADRGMRSLSNAITNNQGTVSTSLTQPYTAGRFKVLSNTLQLNGHIDTNGPSHDVVFSTTGYQWTIYNGLGNSKRFPLGSSTIDSPRNYTDPSDGRFYLGSGRYKSSRTSQQAITAGDTITFNDRWSAMGVVSQSWITSRSFGADGEVTRDTGTSPTLSLMYKPLPNVMTYVAYADSFEQGDTAPVNQLNPVVNEGQALKPYRSTQYEAGVKSQWDGLNLNAAIFRLERPFAYVASDNVFREQGNQVNTGLELMADGEVLSGLHLYGSMTLLDPKLKDTALAATRDKRVVGVPKFQANLLTEYSHPSAPNLVYIANLHYTGKRAANDTNTTWADSFVTLDLGTRYGFKLYDKPAALRVSLNNVTNERYWASIFPGSTDGINGGANAFVGEPREIRASLTVDW